MNICKSCHTELPYGHEHEELCFACMMTVRAGYVDRLQHRLYGVYSRTRSSVYTPCAHTTDADNPPRWCIECYRRELQKLRNAKAQAKYEAFAVVNDGITGKGFE